MVAFIGLKDGKPYEIFTGLADDDDGISIPKNITKGKIIKAYDENGNKHYDFQFRNKRGYKTTIEGLSEKFNPEYWNYAKLISGVLRYGMPIEQVLKLVGFAATEQRKYQYLEKRRRTGVEEIYAQRSQCQRPEVPQMRTGNTCLSGRLPDMYLMWNI